MWPAFDRHLEKEDLRKSAMLAKTIATVSEKPFVCSKVSRADESTFVC